VINRNDLSRLKVSQQIGDRSVYCPWMPRDGALTLSDVRSPTLSIVCEPCNRRGRYSVARLIDEHGDAKLTDLLLTLADCQKGRSDSIHDRCKAVYEGLIATR